MSKLKEEWSRAWDEALDLWSKFTKLNEPIWCNSQKEEKAEELTGSFAMIRLTDYRVVISLRQIEEKDLSNFAKEILAHEIGHHVYAPANLRDNARLAARIRMGLPSKEFFTNFVANLYTDLLINYRLQRSFGLDITGVYKKLQPDEASDIWTLYMRIYEMLFGLPANTLVRAKVSPSMQGDADLGARLIRAYSREWLEGAGRFACLCLPYLMKATKKMVAKLPPWLDTMSAGDGDVIPDGLAEIDEGEANGAIHPSQDCDLTGLRANSGADEPAMDDSVETVGGRKNQYRKPDKYIELMRGVGVTLSDEEIVCRYYRERAVPHLIPFPTREVQEAKDPLPEGLDVWDVASPINAIDWVESVVRSPYIIPGVTTVERAYGSSDGGLPEKLPLDLYLGVDCSGSMNNPKVNLSYPVLAGTIILLSALRTGARVMACLSGEMPGKFSQTNGFLKDEKEIMKVLTGYLGTGYAFGIKRLKNTFIDGPKPKRPTHILVVSDSDLFYMLNSAKDGWEIARQSCEIAGGGATACLEIGNPTYNSSDIEKLRSVGWTVHLVPNMASVVAFARAFAKMKYDR